MHSESYHCELTCLLSIAQFINTHKYFHRYVRHKKLQHGLRQVWLLHQKCVVNPGVLLVDCRPGARIAWLGRSINKFWGGTKTLFIWIWVCGPTEESVQREFPGILRWRQKKRSSSQNVRDFSWILGWGHKDNGWLLQNLRKNSSCPRILEWWRVFWPRIAHP